jgi:hypothetical protein
VLVIAKDLVGGAPIAVGQGGAALADFEDFGGETVTASAAAGLGGDRKGAGGSDRIAEAFIPPRD